MPKIIKVVVEYDLEIEDHIRETDALLAFQLTLNSDADERIAIAYLVNLDEVVVVGAKIRDLENPKVIQFPKTEQRIKGE